MSSVLVPMLIRLAIRHLREFLSSVALLLRRLIYPVSFRARQCGVQFFMPPDSNRRRPAHGGRNARPATSIIRAFGWLRHRATSASSARVPTQFCSPFRRSSVTSRTSATDQTDSRNKNRQLLVPSTRLANSTTRACGIEVEEGLRFLKLSKIENRCRASEGVRGDQQKAQQVCPGLT